MNEKETIDWKVIDALKELDRKQNYLKHAKQCINNACRTVAYYGTCLLLIGGVLYITIDAGTKVLPALFPKKKIEVYETNLNKSNTFEEKYSGLAKKVSEKTGVDERILLGLIAGGRTAFANDLRADGYAGIVPLKPEEAGVTAETLSSDDEQCLMSAAKVFRNVAGEQNLSNLELAVGCFWYREIEKDAKQQKSGWSYVKSAREAYERRMHYDYTAHFEEQLMHHKGAIAAKEHIEKTFAGAEREFWMRRSLALGREIKDPAFLFHCNAVIEASKKYKAGEEFTWIDLLPPKLASAICCSLAYMGGVEFKLENGSGE